MGDLWSPSLRTTHSLPGAALPAALPRPRTTSATHHAHTTSATHHLPGDGSSRGSCTHVRRGTVRNSLKNAPDRVLDFVVTTTRLIRWAFHPNDWSRDANTTAEVRAHLHYLDSLLLYAGFVEAAAPEEACVVISDEDQSNC
eukprot:TRINITY_DN2352_c0_g1_i1.p5 TRINITY_DN2352_c0_g1~~TRINITY_DN2352_c0_g1_i1.p5  ORF type:complete len:142 (-),score=22.25 TRINITY_DN2352_c0_g1_i1:1071-1496(-)